MFYVSEGDLPIAAMGNWNIVCGFGFIAVGFGALAETAGLAALVVLTLG
ncbi:cell division protein CrgA, partial [Streptomyces lydicus]